MKRACKALFLCFILLSPICLIGQINVDSLTNVLETQVLTPREQFRVNGKIRDFYRDREVDKFIECAKQGLSIAEKESDKKFRDKMYDIIYDELGSGYTLKGKYDTAQIYFDIALEYAFKIKDKSIYQIYLNYGALYYQQGRYNTTLEYLLKALSLCREADNKTVESSILGNIGSIYNTLGDLDRAKIYYEQQKDIVEGYKLENQRAWAYANLGSLHYELREYDKALDYYLQAEALCKEQNNIRLSIYNNINLSLIYINGFKDYDKAEKCAEEAMRMAEKLDDPHDIFISISALAEAYLYKKRYRESESLALKAWEMDSTNTENAFGLASIIAISNMYLNNKEKAMVFGEKIQDLVKNLNKKEYHANLMNMEIKYETEKKEMRIASLEKENQLYIWLGIASAAFLLAFIGVLFYWYQLKKQHIKQLEQEKRLIATQSVLEGETAERSRLARDLHDGLGGMLSVVKLNLKDLQQFSIIDEQDVNRYGKALEMLDESITELRRVAHHMMPESLVRYGLKVSLEDFCRAIPIANFQYLGENSRSDSRLEVMIYRCAYELINNAIKYANASIINVQLLADNNLIALTVYDDGEGFDPDKINSGMGLENIRIRVLAYNGKMNIHSIPGEGTEISIEIEVS